MDHWEGEQSLPTRQPPEGLPTTTVDLREVASNLSLGGKIQVPRTQEVPPTPMRKSLIAVLACLTVTVTVTVMAVSALAEITPTLLQGGAGDQISGSSNGTWTMWSSNSSDHPGHYDTFARTATGSPFQVNAMGTEGQSGGLNGLTSQAIYQQTNGDASDLFLYNLSTKTRTNPPSTINTNFWERSPSISARFIPFGRNNFKTSTTL
jgi:hypothetical protein